MNAYGHTPIGCAAPLSASCSTLQPCLAVGAQDAAGVLRCVTCSHMLHGVLERADLRAVMCRAMLHA